LSSRSSISPRSSASRASLPRSCSSRARTCPGQAGHGRLLCGGGAASQGTGGAAAGTRHAALATHRAFQLGDAREVLAPGRPAVEQLLQLLQLLLQLLAAPRRRLHVALRLLQQRLPLGGSPGGQLGQLPLVLLLQRGRLLRRLLLGLGQCGGMLLRRGARGVSRV
jgi:hypothetical protein